MLMLRVQIRKTYCHTETRGRTVIWCYTKRQFSVIYEDWVVGNSERDTYDHTYLFHMDTAM
jgi:hypothetical protein